MRVRGDLPNLVNGVSQQAPQLRLPTQSEIDENTYPLLVDGLVKRPPSRHLAKIGDADIASDAFVHTYVRDNNEKYVVTIETDGTLRVFDFDGDEKTVTNNGADYLADLVDARSELRALTIADYTFIVNKSMVVAASENTADDRPYEAIVHVISGNYGKYHRVFIDGVEEATYQTPDGSVASHVNNIDTIYIADQLFNQLVSAGFNTAPWSISRYHSTIYLKNTTTDFTIGCEDGNSNRSMKAIKNYARQFSDLPSHNAEDFVVRVAGPEGKTADDYWVNFERSSNANSSEGQYKECIKPGAGLGLDNATMPHTLVRNGDGTFTFGPATWSEREVGDEDTNPDPSLVGQTIEDVFFHRNRFGLLSKENAVLSRNGFFFNLYRSTLTALLDTDPIDIAASHVKVSLLRHAVPFQDVLVLFSDQTQFRLAGNELLTPKTVSTRPLTEMQVSPTVRPVQAAASIFFVAESESFAQLFEYFIDKAVETAAPESVTNHVPNYIPHDVTDAIASPDLGFIALAGDNDPGGLFVYRQHVANNEKLQSAWVHWTLPNVSRIASLVMDKSWLVMVVRRGDDFFIERINMESGQAEKVHLDRRVELTGGVYDAGTDTTTFTEPYDLPDEYNLVTVGDGEYPLGVELTLSTPGTLVVNGDLSGDTIYLGAPYDMTHRFSTLFYRDPRRRTRGDVAITDGRLQVINLSIDYSNTSYFQIVVTAEGRDTRTYTFSGYKVGAPSALTGALPISTGRMTVPIMSRNDRVTIDVINNTWRPCAFTSAQWRGIFNPQSREL